jgi:hypothetical protein
MEMEIEKSVNADVGINVGEVMKVVRESLL